MTNTRTWRAAIEGLALAIVIGSLLAASYVVGNAWPVAMGLVAGVLMLIARRLQP